MFENHFALRENPFSSGHQPRFVFPSREHQEALAHLRFGIENREPFVLITGEVGTGKTTALYDVLSDWQGQVQVALINNSALTRNELLEEICLKFGFNLPTGSTKPQVLNQLERHLLAVRARDQRAILLLDEAQNLDRELLEEIRLLSNLEFEGEKLIQVFLVGQPELEERLARPELRQLRQRISVHYRLKPLSPPDTERYIHHRITVAGGYAPAVFPADSCRTVYELSHGIPREINHICSQAMLGAFVEGSPTVRAEHVRDAASEIEFQSVIPEGGPGGADAASGTAPRRLPPLSARPAEPVAAPAPTPPVVARPPAVAPADAPARRAPPPPTPVASPPFFHPPAPSTAPMPVAPPPRAATPAPAPTPSTPVTLPPFFDEPLPSAAPPRWEPTSPPGADAPPPSTEVPVPRIEEPARAPGDVRPTGSAARARSEPDSMERGTRRFSPRRFPRDEGADEGDPSVTTLKWLVAFLAVVAVVMGGVLLVRFKPWVPKAKSSVAPAESTATAAATPAVAAPTPTPAAAPRPAPLPIPALVPPRDSTGARTPGPPAAHEPTGPGPRVMARPPATAAAAPKESSKHKVIAATAAGAGAVAAGAAAHGSAGATGSASPTSSAPTHGSASAPASVSAPASTSAPDSTRKPAVATDWAPKPTVAAAGTFGVAVGTFLDQASAESDRARLAGVTQLPALVRAIKADSVSRFELVLGSFASHAAAERAASDLVTRGIVDEARVVAQVQPASTTPQH